MVEVGVLDNFFYLGGHSLAAARVVARVVQLFPLDLPVKALFESPTVADMAREIVENQSQRASQTDLERLLSDIETISEEEAQRRLEEFNSTIANK